MKKTALSRRTFLAAGSAAAAVTIVPRHAVARSGKIPPSEKINIAGVGIGGMGGHDLDNVAGGNNVVALCDVDSQKAAGKFNQYAAAKKYADFRKMFDEMEKQIDAVVCGTPDHNHAVVSMAAIKRGKHVYCEKPLAHSVWECRELAKAAKAHDVVTQMGNQGHSFETIRMFCEWVWDGAIGNVHTIHLGCAAINSGVDQLGQLKQEHKVPENLDWDLWLGPAQQRPYHPAYHPYNWRGWVPFGNGTLGDWTCHIIDPVFWALDLGAPQSIVAEVKDYSYKAQPDAFPKGDKVTFEFAAKDKRGPVKMVWYSGTERIPRPEMLEPGRGCVDTGAVVLGDKGAIMYGSHGAASVRIIPEVKMKEYKLPEKKIPRVRSHHQDWIDAIREGRKAGSDFAYGAALTEVAMLGVIAIKMAGTKLQWDAQAMRFTNSDEANQFVTPAYRTGWSL